MQHLALISAEVVLRRLQNGLVPAAENQQPAVSRGFGLHQAQQRGLPGRLVLPQRTVAPQEHLQQEIILVFWIFLPGCMVLAQQQRASRQMLSPG